jgi:hypothetical protein
MSKEKIKKDDVFKGITGFNYPEYLWPKFYFTVPYALFQQKERETVQALEVISVKIAADAIEELLTEKGFSRPAIYSILTAGMDVPEEAVLLGKYGEGGSAFASFPKTDIYGHAGEVYSLKIAGERTMLIMKGRAHPYEWSKDPYGDMVVAHPLQVMKEISRRQRTDDGEDPIFILTYLTGVREGQNMRPGDLGVILDDTPGDNDSHPGQGPRAILDEFFGERFQPKDNRASTITLAESFVQFAESKDIKIFPVAAIGTPGTTEFQSSLEATLYDDAFQKALEEGNFGQTVRKIAKEDDAAQLFCMGVTEELATLRQTLSSKDNKEPKEADFKVMALGLATDAVGGAQSTEINHGEVVTAAFVQGKMYRDLIMEFVNSPKLASMIKMKESMPDYSIRTRFN